MNILPNGLPAGTSAANPAPDIHTPEPMPFGDKQKALVCASVFALYAKIQPCHGPLSPCAANARYTIPFNSSKDGRLFSHFGSNVNLPPVLPSPVPLTVAVNGSVGPPNFSWPVVISSACSLCINVVSDTVDFATT